MEGDIRNYILNKLFFPKVAVIDKPGVIINKTVSRFGKEGIKTRVIYHFEDICTELYLKTKAKLGEEKSDLLWYKIGKDVAFRYSLFGEGKKIPSFLMPLVLKHIFDTFSSAGLTFAIKIEHDRKNDSVSFSGKDCVICRKTHNGSVMAGIVSGVFSSLFNQNIEAEACCIDCPKNCRIVVNKQIKERYSPNLDKLKFDIAHYNKVNCELKEIKTDLNSFTDLWRFKKIWIDSSGKFCFMGKTIIPSEIGLSEIILRNYSDYGEFDLFQNTVVETSKNIFREILENPKTISDKFRFLCNMISAFGWGIPYYKKIGKEISFYFLNPPVTQDLPMFKSLILKGYLDKIFDTNFEIKKLTTRNIKFTEIA